MRQTVGYQRFDTGGGINGAEATVCDAALVHQFLSTDDEAQKQGTGGRSREEELPRATNSLSTSAGLCGSDRGGQEEIAAPIPITQSGGLEAATGQISQGTISTGNQETAAQAKAPLESKRATD